MTNLELREWLQHGFVSKLYDAAIEFARHDSLVDPKELFAHCISLAPHILRRLEDPMVSGRIRLAGLRGDLNHNESCKLIFTLLQWDSPTAMEGCRAQILLVRAIVSTHLFAKTEAEAKCLLWRFLKKMIESFGMRWANDYMAESRTEEALLFGGPACAQAQADFEDARQSEIDRMADLFQSPAVGALANETDLRQ